MGTPLNVNCCTAFWHLLNACISSANYWRSPWLGKCRTRATLHHQLSQVLRLQLKRLLLLDLTELLRLAIQGDDSYKTETLPIKLPAGNPANLCEGFGYVDDDHLASICDCSIALLANTCFMLCCIRQQRDTALQEQLLHTQHTLPCVCRKQVRASCCCCIATYDNST